MMIHNRPTALRPALWRATAALSALLLLVGCARSQPPVTSPPVGAPTTASNSQPAWRLVSAPGEFRGAWVHWEDYVSPAAVAATVAKAKAAGLNILLPLANYPDQAMWRSSMLPTNPKVPAGFDPLPALAQAAHEAGLQVHPYLVMLNAGLTKPPGIDPAWYAVDRKGQRVGGWLNPAHPGVRDFLSRLVAEVARTGVDGVSYDYIRHEYNTDYDYGPYTRRVFQAEQGWDPLTDPNKAAPTAGMRLLSTFYHRDEGKEALAAQQAWLTQCGYRPSVVDILNLNKLSRRTLLVAGNLYAGKVPVNELAAIVRFVRGGGALLILDGPSATSAVPDVAEMVGLASVSTGALGPIGLNPAEPTATTLFAGLPPNLELAATGYPATRATTAHVVATMADGRPAIAWQAYGSGIVATINYRIYLGDVASSATHSKLAANLIDWLCERQQITNMAHVATKPTVPMTWDQWRAAQVTELVRECSTAARAARPDIILSAAGGVRSSDLTGIFRDGRTWLDRGYVDFLCAMAYHKDAASFASRMGQETSPIVNSPNFDRLYAGIAAMWFEQKPAVLVSQVELARQAGLKGVCFFAFENLTPSLVSALSEGPFALPAPLPWRLERIGG